MVGMPLAYAIGEYVLNSDEAALFGAFAAFAALGFCNFGGPPKRRAMAYLGYTLFSTPLVALGTVVSRTTVAAVVLTVLVTFAVVMSESLGGYWEAARNATILAFVLGAAVEAPNSQVGPRVAGWLVACGISLVLALVLFPSIERHRVRRGVADVLARAGEALVATADDTAAALTALDDARVALRGLTGISFRPVGTARTDRALKLLVIEAERIGRLVHLHHTRNPHPTGGDVAVSTATATTLATLAEMLRAMPPARPTPPDLEPLVIARADHRQALGEAAQAAAAADDATEAVLVIDRSFPLRRVSLLTLAAGQNAAAAVGLGTLDLDAPGLRALTVDTAPVATATETERRLRADLNLRSVRFRNAVRAAVGLGAAMTLAKLTNIEHGFWVVLGTLSVLRSNAMGTQRTAVQAVSGTVLGFLLASGLMLWFGGDTRWLWIAFPILAFLTAYTPGTVNFMVGQACFTVLVVDLFNLSVPEGWRTGLVRVQDIAIGVVVSLVVGFVLWPRGAEGVVRRAFADMLDADADAFDEAIDQMDGTVDAPTGGALAGVLHADKGRAAEDARERALLALEVLAAERGVEQADRPPWSDLLLVGTGAEWAADGIMRDGASPAGAAVADDAPSVVAVRDDIVRRARTVARELRSTADAVASMSSTLNAEPSTIDEDDVRVAPDEQLAADLTRCVQEGGELPVDLLWSREWILHVERVLHVPSLIH
ncbi:MAG: FUSC family protein [Acidimicrobiia bacterium]